MDPLNPGEGKRDRMMRIPHPGMKGDYRDTCIVCLTATDSALAFSGEAEWIVAALVVLGVPYDEACAMVSVMSDNPPGRVPTSDVMMVIRVCADCVDASPFPKPGVLMRGEATVPLIRHPDHLR